MRLSEELEIVKAKNDAYEEKAVLQDSKSNTLESELSSTPKLASAASQRTLRLKITDTSVTQTNRMSNINTRARAASTGSNTSGVHKRKSYIFALRTPMTSMPDTFQSLESLGQGANGSSPYTFAINTLPSPMPSTMTLIDYPSPASSDGGKFSSTTSRYFASSHNKPVTLSPYFS